MSATAMLLVVVGFLLLFPAFHFIGVFVRWRKTQRAYRKYQKFINSGGA